MSVERRTFQNGTEKLSEAFYSLGAFSFCACHNLLAEFDKILTSFDLMKKTWGVNQYENLSEALKQSHRNQTNYRFQIRRVQSDLDQVLAEYKSIKNRFRTFDKYLS